MSEAPDRTLLLKVFPPKVVKRDAIEGIPPEVFSYKQDFGGRSWADVERKVYETNADVFSCMDHNTLRYFIAGYLDNIIRDPNCYPAEFLVYFSGHSSFVEFCSLLNTEQIRLLLATIDGIIVDDYFSENDRRMYGRQKQLILEQTRAND